MSCDAVLPLLRDYVDRELDIDRAESVERHLAQCPSCAARAQAERDLKQVLRSRTRVGPAPAGLSGQILGRLRREEARGLHPRARRVVLVAAVGLALTVIGTLLLRGTGTPRLTTELIDDHIRYLVSSIPAEPGTADPSSAERWLEAHVNLAVAVPRLPADGPRLLGARRCYVVDRQVALLFYEFEGSRLSLFAMDDHGLDLAGMSRADVPDAECSMDSYKGYHVLGWKRSGLLFALVGRGDPHRLIEAFRPALQH